MSMGVKRIGMCLLTNPDDAKLRRDDVKILQQAFANTVLKAQYSTPRLSVPQFSWSCDAGDEGVLPAATR